MNPSSTPGSPASFPTQQSPYIANTSMQRPLMMATNQSSAGKQPAIGSQPFSMGQPDNAAAAAGSATIDPDGTSRVLPKVKVEELVKQIAPHEHLEPVVVDILLEVADEFIKSATSFACRLAKHRKSDTLEVKDLQLHLERNWDMRVPGFASDDIRTAKKPSIPASHQNKVQTAHALKNQQAASASSKKG